MEEDSLEFVDADIQEDPDSNHQIDTCVDELTENTLKLSVNFRTTITKNLTF